MPDPPTRILFVSNLFPHADDPYLGLDNATVLQHLPARFEVRVLAPRPTLAARAWLGARASGRYQPREIDRPFRPIYVETPYLPKVGSGVNHRLMAWRLRREFRGLRREFPFEVVLCSWLYPDACALARLAGELGVPLVLISQGTDSHQYLSYPVRRRLITAACNRSAGVITRSAELGRLLAQAGVEPEKLHTIYNGVDTSVFHPRPKAELRSALGLDPDGELLLFVGNLLPIKDPLFLVSAFADYLRAGSGDNPRLVMVGKGPLRSEIEAEIHATGLGGRVQFTGPLLAPDVAKWMAAADVLCMSSRNEGLPNVVLEALASGLPIVSTDVGGIGEVIDTPALGKLVALDDRDAYRAALAQVLQSRAEDAGSRDLSWDACAREYAALLDAASGSCFGREPQETRASGGRN